VKHSGEWLYKMSNEEDLLTFKVTKIRLPNELNSDDTKKLSSSLS